MESNSPEVVASARNIRSPIADLHVEELLHTVGKPVARVEVPEQIARDVFAVQQIQAVPTLLQVLCEITGMRFAAVARVTEQSWTLCAVKDGINFGLKPGSQLDFETTLCIEAKRSETLVAIEQASLDPRYRDHHTPKLYHIESSP
jgi:hypothetical protein